VFTMDDLRDIMLSCGTEGGVDLAGDIANLEFDADLGFDSLAMLHVAAQIQHRIGVAIPDDLALELKTPGQLLDFVNFELRAVA
jgi:act minimal PKS acyl carrier protein